jgi:hypothetical protein
MREDERLFGGGWREGELLSFRTRPLRAQAPAPEAQDAIGKGAAARSNARIGERARVCLLLGARVCERDQRFFFLALVLLWVWRLWKEELSSARVYV